MTLVKTSVKTIVTIALASINLTALADSLELANGDVLEGDFVGSSNDIIMFKVGDDIQAYPEKDVVGIFMSAGVKTREAQATSPARSVRAGTMLDTTLHVPFQLSN